MKIGLVSKCIVEIVVNFQGLTIIVFLAHKSICNLKILKNIQIS